LAIRGKIAAIPASLLVLGILLWHSVAPAQNPAPIQVVTTSPDLASITQEIGGDLVQVTSLTRAGDNLHGMEPNAKLLDPLNRADLLIQTGLNLEGSWLERLVRNTSNRKIQEGGAGRLNTSSAVVDFITDQVNDAAGTQGAHAGGNPYFMLDPRKAIEVADLIREQLTTLRPAYEEQFLSRFDTFDDNLRGFRKIQEIRFRALPKAHRKIGAYGYVWSYFADWLNLSITTTLEPSPGVSPMIKGPDKLKSELKGSGTSLVLMASFQPRESIQNIVQMSGCALLPLRIYPNFRSGETYIEHLRDFSKVVHERLSSSR
jgi:zinc/manganese transport system substrate-binding protein